MEYIKKKLRDMEEDREWEWGNLTQEKMENMNNLIVLIESEIYNLPPQSTKPRWLYRWVLPNTHRTNN